MAVQFANNAYATLAAGVASSDTSITLTSGQGARFPSLSGSDYFYATLIDTSNNLEIVKVTARATDVLTVTRGQESTTARAFVAGDRIELRVTAAGLVDATNIDNILPDQSSHSGKFLTTDGTNSSWGVVDVTNATSLTQGTLSPDRMFDGAPLQVVQTVKTDTFSTVGTTYTTVTGLTASITPRSSTNKVLCFFDINIGENSFEGIYRYMRDSTAIYVADAVSGKTTASGMSSTSASSYQDYHMNRVTGVYLDSPATTSSVTYSVQIAGHTSGVTAYINRSPADRSSGNYDVRGTSSITLIEVTA